MAANSTKKTWDKTRTNKKTGVTTKTRTNAQGRKITVKTKPSGKNLKGVTRTVIRGGGTGKGRTSTTTELGRDRGKGKARRVKSKSTTTTKRDASGKSTSTTNASKHKVKVLNKIRGRSKTGNTGSKNLKGAAKRANINVNKAVRQKKRIGGLKAKIQAAKTKGGNKKKIRALKAKQRTVRTNLKNTKSKAASFTKKAKMAKK